MRLTYNGKAFLENELSLKEFLEAQKEAKEFEKFDEFFEFVNSKCEYYKETSFMVGCLEDYLLVFEVDKTNVFSKNNFICSWKFEFPKFKELMLEILRLNEDGEMRMLVSTFSNYFSFIMKPQILNVIFDYNKLLEEQRSPYNPFEKREKKPNGKIKIRKIIAPDEEFKSYLKDANGLLQRVFDRKNSSFQVAYKKGKSVVDNAKIHKKNKYVFNMDLKDFYPSCKRELVSEVLEIVFDRIFNGDLLRDLFLDAILFDDALFIGNPVSGCLANRVFAEPASYMKNIANKFGMEFSVYADDVTFSSDRFISHKCAEGIFLQGLVKFQMEENFKFNEDKSLGYSGMRRRITGVSINDQNKLTVKRNYYRLIRTMLNHLDQGDFNDNLNVLRGKIAYATMVDESDKMKNLLRKYKPTVQKYHLMSDEKLNKLKI